LSLATSEKSAISSTRPVDAAAIPVGRASGVDASKSAGTDGDSIAADSTDDVMLSEAVAQFYTGEKQDCSVAMKVFSHYSTVLLSPAGQ